MNDLNPMMYHKKRKIIFPLTNVFSQLCHANPNELKSMGKTSVADEKKIRL